MLKPMIRKNTKTNRSAPVPGARALIPLLLACVLPGTLLHAAQKSARLDFNRDIRPIFSEHCYACHGPDENKRKAGLRLDNAQSPFSELKSGQRAIVPRDLAKSAMAGRITSTDLDEIMPPPKHGKPLSPEQIDRLKRWIQEGAEWQKHWSFIPPERSALPAVKDKKWPRNSVDYFILSRLETAGLPPNPEADKVTLLRRATLDLTGLPPTIEEVDQFLADRSPDAYEKVVERLFQSPHYGERMAQEWLDLARYADTSGYHFDGVRFMWLWRDWVIDAFNKNKPYDSFSVEQLAGDLLPNPTQSQRIATGFVRNNMTNDEGGADPDEYLNKYVVDRVNTLGAVWMGLTVGCTECHDHKYDPMTSKEFYQLYAFFHNVPEKGLDRIRTDNPPPRLPVPTPEQAMRFVEADFVLKDAEKTLKDRANELGESQEKWESEISSQPRPKLSDERLSLRIPLNGSLMAELNSLQKAGEYMSTGKVEYAEGRPGQVLKLDGKSHVEFPDLGSFDRTNALSYGAWINAQGPSGCVISKMEKEPGYRGYDLLLSESRLEVHLVNKWPENAIKVRSKDPVAQKQWVHVFATYDGSGKASGVRLYVNGKARAVEVTQDTLSDSMVVPEPLRVGSRNGQLAFNGSIGDVRIYPRVLNDEEVRMHHLLGYWPILSKSRGQRSGEERSALAQLYKENYARDYLMAEAALAKAESAKAAFYGQIPTSLIMEEMNPPRETFTLVRGDYRKKGERVNAATPAFLPPLGSAPTNRLALARWLVSKEHPLSSRVAVNRYWAMFFGTGLVKTANDFGSQGEWPSHPELLDWLATQFRDGGPVPHRSGSSRPALPAAQPWDVKAMVRLIVTSAAYRQAAVVSKEKIERDPYNRLISRGPRLRLDAEFIRDNALAISGLLNPAVGGPSVKPYQPPGIWEGVDAVYKQDKGDSLYRRGMYVFWRRSAHYPSFATFDAPNREVCTFARQRTQTPLQSLVLMNDPVYVEAARGLAQRVLREEPADPRKQLLRAFRHALGRVPAPEEFEVLRKTYEHQLASFGSDPRAAEAFLKVGESAKPDGAAPAQLAALAAVANVLLNLNETITK